jgi:biotin carboxylase
MKKRLVILGGGPGIFDRAELLGVDILLIDLPEKFDPLLAARAKSTLLIDYVHDSTFIDLVQVIHRKLPFDAVISLTELGLMPAAKLAQVLGLHTIPVEVVNRIRDKFRMRCWLEENHFPSAKAALGHSIECIKTFSKQVGYPIIVKPRDGLGSVHVTKIERASDLENLQLPISNFLMEECLVGLEISVESFSFAGKHIVLGVTQKLLNHEFTGNPYVEIGHKISADLNAKQLEEIEDYVHNFLDCMNITDGPAHTELMITSNGPMVIETHNRVGGGNIPQLVRLTSGIDILDLCVRWPLRECTPIEYSFSKRRCDAAVRFFNPEPGVIKDISGVEKWKGFPGIVAFHFPYKLGDTIRPMKTSFDRLGFVIATAENSVLAAEICEKVVGEISIHTIM